MGMAEINWEFDAKDVNYDKYGNLSTPTIIKLVSKYNKSTISTGNPANPSQIAEILTAELNRRVESEDGTMFTQIHSEIQKFEALNGFINIFLQNE